MRQVRSVPSGGERRLTNTPPTRAGHEPSVALSCPLMRRDELLARITVDPKVCFGKPCIRGHRIRVSLILDLLADGVSVEQIMDDYPGLEDLNVRACSAYGAEDVDL